MNQKDNIAEDIIKRFDIATKASKDLINLLKNNDLEPSQTEKILQILLKHLLDYQKVDVSIFANAQKLSGIILKDLISLLKNEKVDNKKNITELIEKQLESCLDECSVWLDKPESRIQEFYFTKPEASMQKLIEEVFSELTSLYNELETKKIKDLILNLGDSLIKKYNYSDDDQIIELILDNFYKKIFSNFSDQDLQDHLSFISRMMLNSCSEDEFNIETPLDIQIKRKLYATQVFSKYLEKSLESLVKRSLSAQLLDYFIYLSQLGLAKVDQGCYLPSQSTCTILNRAWFSVGASVLNYHHMEIMRENGQLYEELEKIENMQNQNLLPPNKLIEQQSLIEDLEKYHKLIKEINIAGFDDAAKNVYIKKSTKDFIDIKKLTIFLPTIWKAMAKFIDNQNLFEIYNRVSLAPYDPNYLSRPGLPPKIFPTYFYNDNDSARKDYLEFMIFYSHHGQLEIEYVEFIIFTLALLLKIDKEQKSLEEYKEELPEKYKFDFKNIYSARLAQDIQENKVPAFLARIRLFKTMLGSSQYDKYAKNILDTFNKLHILTAAGSDAITEINELLNAMQSIFEASKTKIEEKYLELVYESPLSEAKIKNHAEKIIKNIEKGYQNHSLVKFFNDINDRDLTAKMPLLKLEIEESLRTEDYTENDLGKIPVEFININGQEQNNLCEASKKYHKKLNEYILNMIKPLCAEISPEEISRHKIENNLILSPIKKLNYENEIFTLINQLPVNSQNQEYIWFLDKETMKKMSIKGISSLGSPKSSIGKDNAKIEYDNISFNYERNEQNHKSTKLRIDANVFIKVNHIQDLGFKVNCQKYLEYLESLRLIIKLLTHFSNKIL